MVARNDGSGKPKRDYSAERARRNALAREQGFTSLDKRAKAIRAGVFPTAKARRTNPAEAERARKYAAEHKVPAPKPAAAPKKETGGITPAKRDEASRKWSRSHARQEGTRFRGEWSEERKDMFYRAFVQWWKLPHDERDFTDTYAYMEAWPDGFAPERDPDYGHAK